MSLLDTIERPWKSIRALWSRQLEMSRTFERFLRAHTVIMFQEVAVSVLLVRELLATKFRRPVHSPTWRGC